MYVSPSVCQPYISWHPLVFRNNSGHLLTIWRRCPVCKIQPTVFKGKVTFRGQMSYNYIDYLIRLQHLLLYYLTKIITQTREHSLKCLRLSFITKERKVTTCTLKFPTFAKNFKKNILIREDYLYLS